MSYFQKGGVAHMRLASLLSKSAIDAAIKK